MEKRSTEQQGKDQAVSTGTTCTHGMTWTWPHPLYSKGANTVDCYIWNFECEKRCVYCHVAIIAVHKWYTAYKNVCPLSFLFVLSRVAFCWDVATHFVSPSDLSKKAFFCLQISRTSPKQTTIASVPSHIHGASRFRFCSLFPSPHTARIWAWMTCTAPASRW